MKVSSKVTAVFVGVTVVEYLAGRFTYLPRSTWQQLLAAGRISHNGLVTDGSATVVRGDRIGCDLPEFAAPAVNLNYSIVYQDQWLLAINKPAGLRVHSGGKFVTANLIYHLRHVHQPLYPEVDLIHRLDADTSGLVLLARDKAVLAQLSQQFAANLVTKRYLAVVEGCPDPAAGSIDLPIGPIKSAKLPRHGVDTVAGKAAVTHYRTLRKLSANYTLLELQPETGRTHQLRVHLAAIGHPLAGDGLYTLNDADYLDWRNNPPPQAILQRQALHSQQLQFFHPIEQTRCTLSAPLATDIEQFIQQETDGDRGETNS